MLSFFFLLFVAGGLSALIPAKELVKIIIMLFTIPAILFLSIKLSQNPSRWSLDDDYLTISFPNRTYTFLVTDIDHIRTLTRSGGTLYVIYFKKKSPTRFWRNKLFQAEDDQIALQSYLTNSAIEYYKF